jgi:hypothetical protein
MAIDDLTRLTGTLRAGLADLEALPDRRTPCDPSCASLAGSASAASETEPVLACSLVATDHGEQLARWSTLLADATVTREGLAAHLELPAIRAAEAAALVVDEQACCPFLGFRLTFTGDTVGLVITAPNPPALPFVDALLEAGDPTCR